MSAIPKCVEFNDSKSASADISADVERLRKSEKEAVKAQEELRSSVSSLNLKVASLTEEKKSLECLVNREVSPPSFSSLQLEKKDSVEMSAEYISELSKLKMDLKSAEEARDRLKEQVSKLTIDHEILDRDRGALVSALESVESILVQVNQKIDAVTAERDSLSNMFQEASRKLSEVLSEKQRSSPVRLPIGVHTLSMQTQTDSFDTPTSPEADPPRSKRVFDVDTKVLLEERDKMQELNQNLESELRMLRNELDKSAMPRGESSKSLSENTGHSLLGSTAFRQLESDRDALKLSLEACERDKALLTDNYAALEKHVARLKEDISNMEGGEDKLKDRVRTLEHERDKEMFSLRQAKSRLSEADVTLERLGKELDRVRKENSHLESQVKQQRDLLESIDHERDIFQSQMDQKDVELSGMAEKLAEVTSMKKAMEMDLHTSQEQVEALNRHLNQLEEDLVGVQSSLNQSVLERDRYAKDAEVFCLVIFLSSSEMVWRRATPVQILWP